MTSFPNEFCIPSDEEEGIGLKIALTEPLLASSFPHSHPEWASLNLELTKDSQKIAFQKIIGLMGPFDKWLRSHFLLPLGWND